MADDKSAQKDDVKINDLPTKTTNQVDDAKVKGGMMPRGGGHMTYTGEEIDTQTGS